MKIALTAPLYCALQATSRGGVETYVPLLAAELVRRGHKVDVYTVESSKIAGRKIAIFPKGSVEQGLGPYERTSWEIAGAIKTFNLINNQTDSYDIIHNNQINFYSLLQAAKLKNALTPLHIQNDNFRLEVARALEETVVNGKYVALSHYQKNLGGLNIIGQVYNGVNLDMYPFNNKPKQHLVWLGRITKEKGAAQAIQIAGKAGVKLRYAGGTLYGEYLNETLLLAKKYAAAYIGPVDGEEKTQFLSSAKALLFPVQWDEPFGYVMIEAMACGTPVIAYNRGSVSEIIKDGVTGYICPPNDEAAMIRTVKKIMELPEEKYQKMRQACRKRVEKFFTTQRMVDGYEAIYDKIIEVNSSK